MGKMIKMRLSRQFRTRQSGSTKDFNPEFHLDSKTGQVVRTKNRRQPRLPVFILVARARRTMRHWYRNWVTATMYCATHLLYQVEVHGEENFSYEPSTVITCAHKRDIDISVVIPCLYFLQRPGRLKALRGLYFPARDDLYERGFLMIYFPWLNRFRFLMRRTSVAFNFRAVQACPVKLPDEQTANQLLNETIRLEGDSPLVAALTDEWYQKLMGELPANSKLRLSDAIKLAPLTVLAQYATPRMFSEPLATRIRERHHRTIMGQLRHLTRVLDKGGSLFIAPEGRVTPDGRFGKMRAAFNRIVQQAHVNLRMLPVNLTYDFMDSQKPKVIVNIGQEVTYLNHYSKNDLSELVKQRVASLATVTMSGIASRWLIEAGEDGREWVRLSQLRDELWTQLSRLRQTDVPMDNRLHTRQGFEERLEGFIQFGFGKGQLFLNKPDATPTQTQIEAAAANVEDFNPIYDRWLNLNIPKLLRTDCNKPDDNPARYSNNELQALLAAWNLSEESMSPMPLIFQHKAEATQRTAG